MILNSVITWDNFFSEIELELIREEVYMANFFKERERDFMGTVYLFSEEVKDIVTNRLSDKLNLHLSEASVDVRRAFDNDCYTENVIHCDARNNRESIVAIIPLNENPNKETMSLNFYRSPEGNTAYPYDYFSKDIDNSKSYLSVEYKTNKAVIFDAQSIHGVNKNSGWGKIENRDEGRLTIHAFFSVGSVNLTEELDLLEICNF